MLALDRGSIVADTLGGRKGRRNNSYFIISTTTTTHTQPRHSNVRSGVRWRGWMTRARLGRRGTNTHVPDGTRGCASGAIAPRVSHRSPRGPSPGIDISMRPRSRRTTEKARWIQAEDTRPNAAHAAGTHSDVRRYRRFHTEQVTGGRQTLTRCSSEAEDHGGLRYPLELVVLDCSSVRKRKDAYCPAD